MTWASERLYDAAEQGDSSSVAEWVPSLKATEVNHSMNNENHNTALIVASKLGHIDCVRALLSHPSIDIHVQNKNGHTAAKIAERSGHTEIVDLINLHAATH